VNHERSAGVLLHPTALPSPFGIGDFGPQAASYVAWLARAGVRWWQVLPLGPPGPGNSPYSATSSFAGNPAMLSPLALVEDGLLEESDLASVPEFPEFAIDFGWVSAFKAQLLDAVYDRLKAAPRDDFSAELDDFRKRHESWLRDYSLFAALKEAHHGAPWYEWPQELKRREPRVLESWREEHHRAVEKIELGQMLFFRQLNRLRNVAAERGVRILGDLPIFVARDSADVWSHPELFRLDDELRPTVVAGVPPDYFSPTGQLWGNPLYDWDRHSADGYRWWIHRLRHCLEMVDMVRLDHFRGFAGYWEVTAEAPDASGGRWVAGPGRPFFDAVAGELGGLPFLAEDLGEITPDVVELRKQLGLPGMAVLHFGFSPRDRSAFIPYAHEKDLAVYTGTHDNNTTVGWFHEDASDAEKDLVQKYTAADGSNVHWDLIRLAMASVARFAVVPHQDLAGLGSDCRMNTPGVAEGNWGFRLTPWMLGTEIRDQLAEMVWTYGRMIRPAEPDGDGAG